MPQLRLALIFLVLVLSCENFVRAETGIVTEHDLHDATVSVGRLESLIEEMHGKTCIDVHGAVAERIAQELNYLQILLARCPRWLDASFEVEQQHFDRLYSDVIERSDYAGNREDWLWWTKFFHELSTLATDIATLKSFAQGVKSGRFLNDQAIERFQTGEISLAQLASAVSPNVQKFVENADVFISIKNSVVAARNLPADLHGLSEEHFPDSGKWDPNWAKLVEISGSEDTRQVFAALQSLAENGINYVVQVRNYDAILDEMVAGARPVNAYQLKKLKILSNASWFQMLIGPAQLWSESQIGKFEESVNELLTLLVVQTDHLANYDDSRLEIARSKQEVVHLLDRVRSLRREFSGLLPEYSYRWSYSQADMRDIGDVIDGYKHNLPDNVDFRPEQVAGLVIEETKKDLLDHGGSLRRLLHGFRMQEVVEAINILDRDGEFSPLETIHAEFTSSRCRDRRMVMLQGGAEAAGRAALKHVLQDQDIGDRSEGRLFFKAPDEAGDYDLRIYEEGFRGNPLAVAGFSVTATSDLCNTAMNEEPPAGGIILKVEPGHAVSATAQGKHATAEVEDCR